MNQLLSKTEYILKETHSLFKNVGVLWSGGKDSTALLHMIADLFPSFPFRVIHLDNGREFPQTYRHMEEIKNVINFPLLIEPITTQHDDISGLVCCGQNKTEALKQVVNRESFDALIVGIRRDEHGIRAKERYFSPRDQEFAWKTYDPAKGKHGEALQEPEFINWGIAVRDFGRECNHVRIHPLLHWNESDVWRYLKEKNSPINELYFSQQGKRFRSIGCTNCSVPTASTATTIDHIIEELEASPVKERDGRDRDKEFIMQRLRSLGYM